MFCKKTKLVKRKKNHEDLLINTNKRVHSFIITHRISCKLLFVMVFLGCDAAMSVGLKRVRDFYKSVICEFEVKSPAFLY